MIQWERHKKYPDDFYYDIEIDGGSFKVRLNLHKYSLFGDKWLLNCHTVCFDHYNLNTSDLEEAKKLAVLVVKERLNKILEKL